MGSNKWPAAVARFFAEKEIAIVGMSREKDHISHIIADKFKGEGYNVVGVNPNTESVGGVKCFATLKDTNATAAMFVTSEKATEAAMPGAVGSKVKIVWLHKAFPPHSVSQTAIELAEKNGIEVIPGACPMMYLNPDWGHRCMKWMLKVGGKLPKFA